MTWSMVFELGRAGRSCDLKISERAAEGVGKLGLRGEMTGLGEVSSFGGESCFPLLGEVINDALMGLVERGERSC